MSPKWNFIFVEVVEKDNEGGREISSTGCELGDVTVISSQTTWQLAHQAPFKS